MSIARPEFLEIAALRDAYRRRRLSPVEALDAFLGRIARLNPQLNAYLSLLPRARTEALAAERAWVRRRSARPLLGVPIAIKDLVLTHDAPTTAGSRAFGAGLASDRDALLVRRLRRAGAVIIGRTNLHEVALGVTSDNEHFGPCRNPWDPTRVAGGSSGGSASAVAAGLCTAAIGTDTRGSIRIPAACCGVVGLKPTYDLVPTEGVVPLSRSLDHAGPMTRSVRDAATLLDVLAGRAPRPLPRARRFTVGISEYHLRDLAADVQDVIDGALRVIRKLGHRCVSVRLPFLEEAHRASTAVAAPEAFHYHEERLRTDPGGFGPLVRQRLMRGGDVLAAQYLGALETRAAARARFADAFRDVDVLVGATLPATPPRVHELEVAVGSGPADVIDAFTRFNSPQNMAGVPAMSVPCGVTKAGLPVGLQLIAGLRREDTLFALGSAFERATPWSRRHPL